LFFEDLLDVKLWLSGFSFSHQATLGSVPAKAYMSFWFHQRNHRSMKRLYLLIFFLEKTLNMKATRGYDADVFVLFAV